MSDPRVSDEATGLPPLGEVVAEDALLTCAWAASEGVARSPATGTVVAVRYLSVRGLALSEDGVGTEWAQVHIAVPVEHALDVAAALARGTTEEL